MRAVGLSASFILSIRSLTGRSAALASAITDTASGSCCASTTARFARFRRHGPTLPLPTGFAYDEAGDAALDPDAQVRETIAYLFETFSRVGSACQTVKAFRQERLCFPSRLRNQTCAIKS